MRKTQLAYGFLLVVTTFLWSYFSSNSPDGNLIILVSGGIVLLVLAIMIIVKKSPLKYRVTIYTLTLLALTISMLFARLDEMAGVLKYIMAIYLLGLLLLVELVNVLGWWCKKVAFQKHSKHECKQREN